MNSSRSRMGCLFSAKSYFHQVENGDEPSLEGPEEEAAGGVDHYWSIKARTLSIQGSVCFYARSLFSFSFSFSPSLSLYLFIYIYIFFFYVSSEYW